MTLDDKEFSLEFEKKKIIYKINSTWELSGFVDYQ